MKSWWYDIRRWLKVANYRRKVSQSWWNAVSNSEEMLGLPPPESLRSPTVNMRLTDELIENWRDASLHYDDSRLLLAEKELLATLKLKIKDDPVEANNPYIITSRRIMEWSKSETDLQGSVSIREGTTFTDTEVTWRRVKSPRL
jgi:hypothetical protein